ncbi:MAG: AraC family transcriptional regulator [Parabacteroides sp.]
MIKIKEGFKGEKVSSLPEDLLQTYSQDPLIGNLYLRKIGYFPKVQYHYVQKEQGCNYYMLIYCTGGKGWYRLGGVTYPVRKDQYFLLPAYTPYSFGADDNDPWTIYFLHFRGRLSSYFLPQQHGPQTILPGDNSRLQDRIRLFEDIYQNFTMGYIKEYMVYSSLCLYALLGSFNYVTQFRYSKYNQQREVSFSTRVIHYMQENLQHDLTLQQLAGYFKYSPSHFSLLFQKETQVSPINYFIRLKIQKACEYLEITRMKINEISQMLGFDEPAYFSRIFTKIIGMTPSEYRKQESEHNPIQSE